MSILSEDIDSNSDDIDYLERAIKCVELYQWLARHFQNKNFSFDEVDLLQNKSEAIEKLNTLLSEKTSKRCSSCGCKLPDAFDFYICETCFNQRRFTRRPDRSNRASGKRKDSGSGKGKKKSSNKNNRGPQKGGFKASGAKKKSRGKSKNKASAFKRG